MFFKQPNLYLLRSQEREISRAWRVETLALFLLFPFVEQSYFDQDNQENNSNTKPVYWIYVNFRDAGLGLVRKQYVLVESRGHSTLVVLEHIVSQNQEKARSQRKHNLRNYASWVTHDEGGFVKVSYCEAVNEVLSSEAY